MTKTLITVFFEIPKRPKSILNYLTDNFQKKHYSLIDKQNHLLIFRKTSKSTFITSATLYEYEQNISSINLKVTLGPEQDGPQSPLWINFDYDVEFLSNELSDQNRKILQIEASNLQTDLTLLNQ